MGAESSMVSHSPSVLEEYVGTAEVLVDAGIGTAVVLVDAGKGTAIVLVDAGIGTAEVLPPFKTISVALFELIWLRS